MSKKILYEVFIFRDKTMFTKKGRFARMAALNLYMMNKPNLAVKLVFESYLEGQVLIKSTEDRELAIKCRKVLTTLGFRADIGASNI